ncbi:hypothetical protein CHCC14600_4405 [Bacillus licheniformis]|nr:hypothetical protein B4090_2631 [Bacillus licheniformis]OLG10746.1 hypothetical protein B4123_2799 [Bacillus paralicheniformis]TWN16275.1 hypothetical protein CHCC14564_0840 [Bacillus licheniformis LMG 17339]KYC81336.1 hypothetical protein B4091_3356 [Bacillus licheniformis]OLF92943.1 hypothetical protein B4089_1915 [Bacillus licheniformis]
MFHFVTLSFSITSHEKRNGSFPCPKQKTRFIEKAGLFYRQVK